MIAYCYASGQIEFGRTVPEGAIEIMRGPARKVRKLIEARARHAYDGKTLLVPGVPEAPNEDAALAALIAFVKWLQGDTP